MAFRRHTTRPVAALGPGARLGPGRVVGSGRRSGAPRRSRGTGVRHFFPNTSFFDPRMPEMAFPGVDLDQAGGLQTNVRAGWLWQADQTNDNTDPAVNPFGSGARVSHEQWTLSFGVSWSWARNND